MEASGDEVLTTDRVRLTTNDKNRVLDALKNGEIGGYVVRNFI